MKKILLIIFLASAAHCFSQNNVRVRISDSDHDAAYNYLLDANRPYPDVSSDMNSKGISSSDLTASFNQDYTEFSATGMYGLTDNFNLIGMMTLLTTNYNLIDRKTTGVGDFLLLGRYMINSGNNFSTYTQAGLKIPIAKSNDQTGTGKFDYHFAVIENYSNENISCDLSAAFDMLGRPDFPQSQFTAVQQSIDSVKYKYEFSHQPNYTVSLYPSYFVNEDLNIDTGIDFSRDMKLNYNSSTFYLGFGYNLSETALLSAGSSFNILNSSSYYISTNLSLGF